MKIVIATALMAIARKVIVLDFRELTPDYIWATGSVVAAMGGCYWIVHKLEPQGSDLEHM